MLTVREMVGMDEERLDKDNGYLMNAFMITTVPGGHNSGRTYYFQASSPDSYFQLTRHLLANTKAARKRAEFNTRFTKSQYNMRKLFNSRIFKYFSALLIVLVCEHLHLESVDIFIITYVYESLPNQ